MAIITEQKLFDVNNLSAGDTQITFNFTFTDAEQVAVQRVNADGSRDTLRQGVDYTIAPSANNQGGFANLATGAVEAGIYIAYLATAYERQTDFTATAPEINNELNNFQLQAQETRRESNRAIKFGYEVNDGEGAVVSAGTAGQVLGYKDDGTLDFIDIGDVHAGDIDAIKAEADEAVRLATTNSASIMTLQNIIGTDEFNGIQKSVADIEALLGTKTAGNANNSKTIFERIEATESDIAKNKTQIDILKTWRTNNNFVDSIDFDEAKHAITYNYVDGTASESVPLPVNPNIPNAVNSIRFDSATGIVSVGYTDGTSSTFTVNQGGGGDEFDPSALQAQIDELTIAISGNKDDVDDTTGGLRQELETLRTGLANLKQSVDDAIASNANDFTEGSVNGNTITLTRNNGTNITLTVAGGSGTARADSEILDLVEGSLEQGVTTPIAPQTLSGSLKTTDAGYVDIVAIDIGERSLSVERIFSNIHYNLDINNPQNVEVEYRVINDDALVVDWSPLPVGSNRLVSWVLAGGIARSSQLQIRARHTPLADAIFDTDIDFEILAGSEYHTNDGDIFAKLVPIIQNNAPVSATAFHTLAASVSQNSKDITTINESLQEFSIFESAFTTSQKESQTILQMYNSGSAVSPLGDTERGYYNQFQQSELFFWLNGAEVNRIGKENIRYVNGGTAYALPVASLSSNGYFQYHIQQAIPAGTFFRAVEISSVAVFDVLTTQELHTKQIADTQAKDKEQDRRLDGIDSQLENVPHVDISKSESMEQRVGSLFSGNVFTGSFGLLQMFGWRKEVPDDEFYWIGANDATITIADVGHQASDLTTDSVNDSLAATKLISTLSLAPVNNAPLWFFDIADWQAGTLIVLGGGISFIRVDDDGNLSVATGHTGTDTVEVSRDVPDLIDNRVYSAEIYHDNSQTHRVGQNEVFLNLTNRAGQNPANIFNIHAQHVIQGTTTNTDSHGTTRQNGSADLSAENLGASARMKLAGAADLNIANNGTGSYTFTQMGLETAFLQNIYGNDETEFMWSDGNDNLRMTIADEAFNYKQRISYSHKEVERTHQADQLTFEDLYFFDGTRAKLGSHNTMQVGFERTDDVANDLAVRIIIDGKHAYNQSGGDDRTPLTTLNLPATNETLMMLNPERTQTREGYLVFQNAVYSRMLVLQQNPSTRFQHNERADLGLFGAPVVINNTRRADGQLVNPDYNIRNLLVGRVVRSEEIDLVLPDGTEIPLSATGGVAQEVKHLSYAKAEGGDGHIANVAERLRTNIIIEKADIDKYAEVKFQLYNTANGRAESCTFLLAGNYAAGVSPFALHEHHQASATADASLSAPDANGDRTFSVNATAYYGEVYLFPKPAITTAGGGGLMRSEFAWDGTGTLETGIARDKMVGFSIRDADGWLPISYVSNAGDSVVANGTFVNIYIISPAGIFERDFDTVIGEVNLAVIHKP